jgi:integrase
VFKRPKRGCAYCVPIDDLTQICSTCKTLNLLSNLPTTADKPGRKRSRGTKEQPLCPVSAPLAALLKTRLLLAQRGGEVARMRWADLDLDSCWWTIPGTDTKNGQPHRVPLVPDAISIIQAQEPIEPRRGVYVFTGDGDTTVLHRAKKAPAAVARALSIEFRGHDLRRTAATQMAEAGVPREHISFVLNHVDGGSRATKIYDRYSRDNEKRIALETWARRLMSMLENRRASAVVPFTKLL